MFGGSGRKAPTRVVRAVFDLDVFQQNRWWQAPDGSKTLLDQMRPQERLQLASWLIENERHFYLVVLRHDLIRTAIEGLQSADTGGPQGETTGVARALRHWLGRARSRWRRQDDSVPEGRAQLDDSTTPQDSAADGAVPELVFFNPRQWLESTPLFQALVE